MRVRSRHNVFRNRNERKIIHTVYCCHFFAILVLLLVFGDVVAVVGAFDVVVVAFVVKFASAAN